MHTEHLNNVRSGWLFFGWFVALSVASSIVLVSAGAGLLEASPVMEALIVGGGVAVGWAAGGYLVGRQVAAAPILHGVGMAVLSFVAWFVLSLAVGGLTGDTGSFALIGTRSAAVALLVQLVTGVIGCWAGYKAAPVRKK